MIKKKTEQVDCNGEVVNDYDISLSRKEIFLKLQGYFPNIEKEDGLIVGKYNNTKYSISIKNITYLGNPHPLYKKRIQIAGLNEFYSKSLSKCCVPLLLGIYTYKDVTIFCDFSINTYLHKKAHNSSAHVYTDDIAKVFDEENGGIFQKEDYFKNTITVFKPEYVNVFLSEKLKIVEEETSKDKNELISEVSSIKELEKYYEENTINNPNQLLEMIFNEFFSSENKVWNGIDCYKKMIDANYKNKFQPEWAGFYLEFELSKFINDNKLKKIVKYAQDRSRDGIDLDLYFPSINSFGDLKAHSLNSRAIQGNDWETIFKVLNSNEYSNHIYYIVCEHKTNKDKDYGYKVTKFWNKVQNKSNLMSYSSRMKNSVQLTKYYILDINNENKEYLTKFRQGINSDGHLREPKIMIENDNLEKFIIVETNFNI